MQTKGIVMQIPCRVESVWHCALQSVALATRSYNTELLGNHPTLSHLLAYSILQKCVLELSLKPKLPDLSLYIRKVSIFIMAEICHSKL